MVMITTMVMITCEMIMLFPRVVLQLLFAFCRLHVAWQVPATRSRATKMTASTRMTQIDRWAEKKRREKKRKKKEGGKKGWRKVVSESDRLSNMFQGR